MSADQITTILAQHGKYTSYSIRRGALSHLASVAATRQSPITPLMIASVAKHTTEGILPSATVRYLSGNPAAVAKMMGTDLATNFL